MRKGDGGQNGWDQAVRAFRNAVNVLTDPAHWAFTDILLVERFLTILSPDLPLVQFSPIKALSIDLTEGRRGHAPVTGKARATIPHATTGQLGNPHAPAEPRMSPSPGQGSSLPSTPPLEGSKSVAQPLVFSFRRQGQCANNNHVPVASTSHGWPTPNAVEKHRARPMSFKKRLREQAGANNQSDLSGGWESSAPTGCHKAKTDPETTLQHQAPLHPLPNGEPLQTISLIDGLADLTLQQAESTVLDRPLGAETAKSEFPKREQPPTVNMLGPVSPVHQVSKHPERGQPGLGAWVLATGERNDDPTPTEPMHAALSAESPRDAFVGSAAMLIESLADNLLFSRGEAARKVAQPHRSPSKRAVASASSGLIRSQLNELEAIAHGYGEQIDADALASLINDVLIRQGRRHGVDMS